MSRYFAVRLNETVVGMLFESDEGRVAFRFTDRYRAQENRSVLSQSFEDDLGKTYGAKLTRLPAFFANLVPEGQLRDVISRSAGIDVDDALGLLAAAGRDLPGAVEIVPASTLDEASTAVELEDGDHGGDGPVPESEVLRFSLAGVQMKFSVVRAEEKLALPAHNALGDWIVKLDSTRFTNLPANEYATLEWARAAGFEVPECQLQPLTSLSANLQGYAVPGSQVFSIRRYDRDGLTRIHQEDFAQVVGLQPDKKYEQLTYEQCAALVRQVAGPRQYEEFIRRLAFMVACGNVDAHLKNWSFVYPDRVNPVLAPLYDQVVTVAWPELPLRLSLKFAGTKDLLKIDEAAFARLAERAGGNVKETVILALRTLDEIASAWQGSRGCASMPATHVAALQEYWTRAPLLRSRSDVFDCVPDADVSSSTFK